MTQEIPRDKTWGDVDLDRGMYVSRNIYDAGMCNLYGYTEGAPVIKIVQV